MSNKNYINDGYLYLWCRSPVSCSYLPDLFPYLTLNVKMKGLPSVNGCQLTGEEILVGRTVIERIAQETELVYLLSHWADIIERATYHIVGIGQVLVTGGLIICQKYQYVVSAKIRNRNEKRCFFHILLVFLAIFS